MSKLSAIHVGLKQLNIDEDDSRDLYERVTGKRSLRQMSFAEHQLVLAELARLGFKKTSAGARKNLKGKYAPKLQALWIAAWNLGIVENRNDEALIAFVKRQTKVDHVRFVRHAEDADKVIEALKAWMVREGGVDWSNEEYYSKAMRQSGYKIAAAQWDILNKHKKLGDWKGFAETAKSITGINDLNDFKEANWIPVMNALGEKVRALKASQCA